MKNKIKYVLKESLIEYIDPQIWELLDLSFRPPNQEILLKSGIVETIPTDSFRRNKNKLLVSQEYAEYSIQEILMLAPLVVMQDVLEPGVELVFILKESFRLDATQYLSLKWNKEKDILELTLEPIFWRKRTHQRMIFMGIKCKNKN